jgi:hypothetical protein
MPRSSTRRARRTMGLARGAELRARASSRGSGSRRPARLSPAARGARRSTSARPETTVVGQVVLVARPGDRRRVAWRSAHPADAGAVDALVPPTGARVDPSRK